MRVTYFIVAQAPSPVQEFAFQIKHRKNLSDPADKRAIVGQNRMRNERRGGTANGSAGF
jgi:hypothetical protein